MRSVSRAVLLLVFLCSIVQSQDLNVAWTRPFDNPADSISRVIATALDPFGNLIVAGSIDLDYGILKYSGSGELRWEKRFGFLDNGGEWPTALAVDAMGEIYVTGSSLSSLVVPLNYDFMTLKLRANGDSAWIRRFDLSNDRGDRADALALDSARNIYVAGLTVDAHDTATWVIIKYHNDGEPVWIRQYREEETTVNRVRSVCATANGDVYVTGTVQKGPAGDDIAVLKYDSSGTLLWTTKYDSPNHRNDTAAAAVLDGSGNLYLAGWSQVNADQTNTDLLLLKIAPDGSIAWVQSYDGPYHGEEGAASLALDPSGNVIVVGKTYAGPGRYTDYLAAKYTSSGQLLWTAALDGGLHLHDEASALAVDGVGNAYVTGFNQSAGNCWSLGTVKLYRSGVVAWSMHYGGSSGKCHYDPHILVDNSGGVYVTGTAEDDGLFGFSNIVSIKYQQLFCCSGLTGNIDRDGRNLVDISDLTLLITYLFGSPTPSMPCREEAILDGQTDITITDLQLLAEYLFGQGPATLPACP